MSENISGSWISTFCSRAGNQFFCEVDESFISDPFNHEGIDDFIPDMENYIPIILGDEMATSAWAETAAQQVYGLLHARYIQTPEGSMKMLRKYVVGAFERCRRVLCRRARMLPIGLSDYPGCDTVKLYCPRCSNIYKHKSATVSERQIDGAYFGTSFPQQLFMNYPELRRYTSPRPQRAGGPSAAVRVPTAAEGIPSPAVGAPSAAAGAPSTTAGAPSATAGAPSATAGAPSATAGAPSATAGAPSATAGAPSATAGAPSATAGAPSATAGAPSATAVAPSATAGAPSATAGAPSATAGVPSAAVGVPSVAPGDNDDKI